jgi:hypothetical protein
VKIGLIVIIGTFLCVYKYVSVYLYLCICIHMNGHIYICIYIYIYICIYIYIRVCIYKYLTKHHHYRWSKYDEPVPGWELPASWTLIDTEGDQDRGPRNHGWLIVTYRSSGFGCQAMPNVRKMLRKKLLIGLKRGL